MERRIKREQKQISHFSGEKIKVLYPRTKAHPGVGKDRNDFVDGGPVLWFSAEAPVYKDYDFLGTSGIRGSR